MRTRNIGKVEMTSENNSERQISTTHVVKGEDLNHHETLYGGRCVEWSIETAYITAANCFDEAARVAFMSIRSLSIRSPARVGDVLCFTGRIDYVGESTIGVRVEGRKLHPRSEQQTVVTGSFLFCTVDERGKAEPHGLPAVLPESNSVRHRWEQAEEAASQGIP